MSNNGGWNKMVLTWDWHKLAMDGFPGWEIKDRTVAKYDLKPYSVFLKDIPYEAEKSSRQMATETDDIVKGQFYYRDYTSSGIPIIREGDKYNSQFWFQYLSDAIEFANTYGGERIGFEKCLKCSWNGEKLYKKCRECYNFPPKEEAQPEKVQAGVSFKVAFDRLLESYIMVRDSIKLFRVQFKIPEVDFDGKKSLDVSMTKVIEECQEWRAKND